MSYRKLLTRNVLTWAVVSVAGKLPIAMAPLGVVFLVRETPEGYTLGATLAAVYVVGEVVGAAVLGTLLNPRRIRGHLAAGLVAGALGFVGLAVARTAPPPVLVMLAFLAGAGPAASPGGLRSMLTSMVAEEDVPRALSLETTLTQIIWAVAPALVVVLALRTGPGAPMGLGAICVCAAGLLVFLLPVPMTPDGPQQPTRSVARVVLTGWPIYLTSAAAMAMLSTAELVLPAMLEHRGLAVGWAGPLLTGFAVVSAIGAFCYGLRTWPGGVHTQSLVFLVLTAACVASIAVLPGLGGIATGLLLAGLFQAGVMVTRNLSLRERLPQSVHASAYSVMYAVQGIGYSVTATVTAVVLAYAVPTVAVLGGAMITLLLTAVSALAERRQTSAGEIQTARR